MARENWSKVFFTVMMVCCLYSCSQFLQPTPTAIVPTSTSTPIPYVITFTPLPYTTLRGYDLTATAHVPTPIPLSAYVTYVQTDKADWVTYSPRENSGPLPGNSIAIAPNGDIWTTGKGEVSRFTGSYWMTYLIPDGKSSEETGYWLNDIAIGQDNSVWVGGNNYPLYRFDGTTWHIELEAVSIMDIEINPIDGAVWIADTEVGIRKYDGINWTIHPNVTGMFANTLDITIDKNGIVWVISLSSISSYDGQVWTKYPEELFCAEPNCEAPWQSSTSIIAASDGSIWFTFNGVALFHYINGNWERYENKTLFMGEVMGFPPIHMCFSPDGNLWLGKYGQYNLSLSYFDGEDLYVPYILSDTGKKSSIVDTINDIACADDGSIWMVSASMGVVHYIP